MCPRRHTGRNENGASRRLFIGVRGLGPSPLGRTPVRWGVLIAGACFGIFCAHDAASPRVTADGRFEVRRTPYRAVSIRLTRTDY